MNTFLEKLKKLLDKTVLSHMGTTSLCLLRCALALVLVICASARVPRIILTVLWALSVAVWTMIALPRERNRLQIIMHIATDLLLYIAAAVKSVWMIVVLAEYVIGTGIEVLLRVVHDTRTYTHTGVLWHDCAASITLFSSLYGMLLVREMTPYNFFLLSCLCLIMRVSSQVAYAVYYLTDPTGSPRERREMTNIEFQTMIMELLMALSAFILFFSKGDPYLGVMMWKPLYLFMQFAAIVGCIGIPSFFLGEQLPRGWFHYDSFPYRSFGWEQDGRIYDRIRIREWKERTPDMSRFMSRAFSKQGNLSRDPAILRRMVQETCSAEFVHWVLVALSWIFLIGMDRYGLLAMLLYIVGNLISIMIQRYNRPRVVMLLKRMEKKYV